MQIVDPHIGDGGEDEGGGAAYAFVVEGVILDTDLPDSLNFPGLVNGVLQGGGVGADTLGRGEMFAVLFCVGVCRVYDVPEVVFCAGLALARLEY